MSDSKRAYERVLGVVEHNTGGPQPATIAEHTVVLHLHHSSVTVDQGLKGLRRATTDGLLARIDGRYCLTGDGKAFLRERRS